MAIIIIVFLYFFLLFLVILALPGEWDGKALPVAYFYIAYSLGFYKDFLYEVENEN